MFRWAFPNASGMYWAYTFEMLSFWSVLVPEKQSEYWRVAGWAREPTRREKERESRSSIWVNDCRACPGCLAMKWSVRSVRGAYSTPTLQHLCDA